ncbi:MAG TPA: Ig-like domain repeat protein [Candidatus Acidoferrum sp.]
MPTSKLLRRLSILSLLFCTAADFGQTPPPSPVPLISQVTPPSLSPAAFQGGSFTLTILGANFAPGELVELSADGWSPTPTAIAFNPTVNATGTQMVANFANVSLPAPVTLTVKVTKRDMTGAPLLASNPYYLPVTPSAQTALLESPVTSFVQGYPTGMVAADFNGDGLPDLAVISQVSNTVSILIGNFGGPFTAGASYPTGNFPRGVVAADFNGDHVMDLAVTNAYDNTVSILLGNGDGTFRPGTTISDPGMYPTQLVAADFNGDGNIDLAVLNVCGTGQYGCYPTAVPLGPANVAILLGNGDGTFNAAPTMPATGLVPAAIAAADLNQDGFIDLVVANSSNNLTLLMGNGDGTFSAASNTPSTGFTGPPAGIAIGDFNGDGTLDVAVTSSGDQDVAVLLNENCAGLPAPQCSLTPMPPELATFVSTGLTAIATADMNADGLLDLVVVNSNAGTVSILLGDGTGKFNPLPWPNQSFATGNSPQALALIDFNQDGRLDVVTANQSGSYSVMRQAEVMQLQLTTSNSVLVYGYIPTLTVQLTPPPGAPAGPTGTISLFDGSTQVTSTTLSGYQYQVQFVLPQGYFIWAGTHQLTAVYSGDTNFVPVTSNVVTETVTTSATTTTLNSNLSNGPYGTSVTLTASIQPQVPAPATGTVTFTDTTNSTTLGTATISSNSAQLTLTNLGAGPHVIVATYSGDGNCTGSSSPSVSVTITQASTSTTVSASPNAAQFGQSVALTAALQFYGSGTPTGTVTFLDGSTSLGTVNLSNNAASLSTSMLAVGAHLITAQYNGDSNFQAGSGTVNEVVNTDATTTTVTSGTNPSSYGQGVVYTVSTSFLLSNLGTPAGLVTLYDGNTALSSAYLSKGSAQFTISTLAAGSHSITATYNGDANVAGSTSAVLTETVNLLPTSTTVASNLNPATFGQVVTLTATVQAGSGISVAGTVTFLDGSLGLGTVTLATNSAQLTTSTLAPGAHTLTAVYNSNGNFAGSTSAALTETVNQLTTTTTLASSVNPALAGQAVTFTATVQAGAGNSPVGAVTFLDGSTTLGSTAVINNSAQLTIATLAPGSHSITAAYGGSTDFAASTSSALTETVNQSSTTTTLVSNLNPATFGQGVPFIATVQTASGGAATGTVTFYDGGATLGTASVVNNNSQHNVAQLMFTGFLGGPHTITAAYSGDANYTASTSGALTETINPASSTVTVGASSNPATFGQAVILTATVVPSVSGTPATGTVTFFDKSSSLGTGNLSNNVAQISVGNFMLGAHSITASYAGDRNFAGSTSGVLAEVVNPAPTSTVVTSSANPAVVKSNVTFTATVSSSSAGTQSGQVSFYLDGSSTAAATVNLSNGAAKYSTNSLSAGSHSVVAVFTSSNPDFSGSTSTAFTQFISDFTLAVSPSSLTVARSSSGTYTLTVTPVGEFSGTVSLSCGGAPGGTTCAISPTQVTLSGSGSAQATVTITAAQNASKGTHTLTFTGTSGGLNHKITASLTID